LPYQPTFKNKHIQYQPFILEDFALLGERATKDERAGKQHVDDRCHAKKIKKINRKITQKMLVFRVVKFNESLKNLYSS
jgi:hypothetical protein